jgi:hypothetical protein
MHGIAVVYEPGRHVTIFASQGDAWLYPTALLGLRQQCRVYLLPLLVCSNWWCSVVMAFPCTCLYSGCRYVRLTTLVSLTCVTNTSC